MKSFSHSTFGVGLPLVAFFVEMTSGMSAEMFADPMPTWWHALIVLFVPFANLVALLAINRSLPIRRPLLFANGIAIGIATLYTLMFVPMIPVGVVGILLMGAGLLPLSPLFSLISAATLAVALCDQAERQSEETRQWSGFLAACAVGFLATLIPLAPAYLTRHWVGQFASARPEASRAALGMLRTLGSDRELLRLCYARPNDLISLGPPTSQRAARDAYFAVTGTPYNATHLPTRRWTDRRTTFDDALGGESVSGRLEHVHLVSSRIDTDVQLPSALTYTEWTMQFRNDDSWQQHEARMQVLLPADGVVSRLTLWVNGEPREAAFSGTGHVRAAYRSVAVERRRDPVLVTWKGPDRVLVQCFPIPPEGGEMKIRLGITTPLTFKDRDGLVCLPRLIERNFNIPEGPIHSIAISSTSELDSSRLAVGRAGSAPMIGRGMLSDDALAATSVAASVENAIDAVDEVWTGAGAELAIAGRLVHRERSPVNSIVCVLDGSVAMAEHREAILQALSDFWMVGSNLKLFVASDALVSLDAEEDSTDRLTDLLQTDVGIGGCNNARALIAAWDWASSRQDVAIVWIHGPQPVACKEQTALDQRFENKRAELQLYDFSVAAGPNRLLESDFAIGVFQHAVRKGSVAADLRDLLASLNEGASLTSVAWSARELTTADLGLPPLRDHLSQLWAAAEVRQRLRERTPESRQGAIQLASAHHIVSPVSGAVVLETAEQFEEAGLTPVDQQPRSSSQTTPEPAAGLLAMLGLFGLGDWHRRRAMGR